MRRILTVPSPIVVATEQRVSRVAIELEWDPATGTLDMNASHVRYVVQSFDNTSGLEQRDYSIPLSQIPGAARQKLRDVYALAVNHAESNGGLGAGTDHEGV